MKKAQQPIIIIGMHRSGTTMIASMLRELGLFIGNDLEKNSESQYFMMLNAWILKESGGRWDNPTIVLRTLQNAMVRNYFVEYIKTQIELPVVSSYLGISRYLRYGGLNNLDFPWCWKDPVNTFTLPIWLDIFPNAKIIHVYRNGIDVASSLRERSSNEINKELNKSKIKKSLTCLRSKLGPVATSFNTLNLEYGFRLWEEYVAMCRTHRELLANPFIEIKYEAFLENPLDNLNALVQFCGLPNIDNSKLAVVAQDIKTSRKMAYKNNSEVVAFANSISSGWLNELGYQHN